MPFCWWLWVKNALAAIALLACKTCMLYAYRLASRHDWTIVGRWRIYLYVLFIFTLVIMGDLLEFHISVLLCLYLRIHVGPFSNNFHIISIRSIMIRKKGNWEGARIEGSRVVAAASVMSSVFLAYYVRNKQLGMRKCIKMTILNNSFASFWRNSALVAVPKWA